MIVHQETTTDGKVIFLPWQCEFCQLNTAGQHDYKCPNNPLSKKRFIPDPVEDYSDPVEYF